MIEKKDFFTNENRVDNVSDEAYNDIARIIKYIDTFARVTHKTIYVIDYYKQNFLYVSDNPLFLCGLTAKKVKELGYQFYIEQVVREDLPLLLEVNRVGFQFHKDVPIEEREEYTLSYDFHVKNKISGKRLLVNHQITPMQQTKTGQLWLALCAVSISSSTQSGNFLITKNNSSRSWFYDETAKEWEEVSRPILSSLEMEVLRLSAMGYTMQDIATKIYRAFDTVRGYRKDILEKLGVDNIVTAINYAKNHRLI
jgi:DNA-binding CsgD family transcriptional regulator